MILRIKLEVTDFSWYLIRNHHLHVFPFKDACYSKWELPSTDIPFQMKLIQK